MLKNGFCLLNVFTFNACFLMITGIYLDQRNENQITYVLNCSGTHPMFALPPYLELLTYKISYPLSIYVYVLCPYQTSDIQLQFFVSYTCDRQLNTTSAWPQYHFSSCQNISLTNPAYRILLTLLPHISGSQPVFSRGPPEYD
jgi:hypothetical protein